jgi:hypothetical protein
MMSGSNKEIYEGAKVLVGEAFSAYETTKAENKTLRLTFLTLAKQLDTAVSSFGYAHQQAERALDDANFASLARYAVELESCHSMIESLSELVKLMLSEM